MNLIKQLLYFTCTVGFIVNFLQVSTPNAAFERTSSHMLRRVMPSLTSMVTAPNGGYRHSTTSTVSLNPKCIYAQATENPIFKYIMHDSDVRNSFLTGIIGEEVIHSELADSSLNPMRGYAATLELFSRPELKVLIADIVKRKKEIEVRHKKTKYPFKEYALILNELSSIYHELVEAIPGREQNTQLDLVCETNSGLINVEVQVEPQDFWDIRILDHTCGLFHSKFAKRFELSHLESESDIRKKVKRVIGVTIFEKPPVSLENVYTFLPWYQLYPWKYNELRRNYQILGTNDPKKNQIGLEFYNYNLAALQYVPALDVIREEGVILKEWLDLLATAHLKTKEEIDESVQTMEVKKLI